MNMQGVMQIVIFMIVLAALVKPLGDYMAKVYLGERTLLSPVLGPIERGIYRLSGIDANAESDWKRYAVSGAAGEPHRFHRRLCAAAPAGRAAAQPAGVRRRVSPDSVVQHRGELCHATPTGRATAASRR